MRSLVIKTEKIVKRGIKFRRILKIEGDRLCDLPQRYETGYPHCDVLNDEGTNLLKVVSGEKGGTFIISERKMYLNGYFKKFCR